MAAEEPGDILDAVELEEVFVKVLASPQRPSLKDVELQNATHLPYRSWCPVCVKAKGRESPHERQAGSKDGKVMISIDYKSFGETLEDASGEDQSKLRAAVMRDHQTEMISGISLKRKAERTSG